MSDARQFLDLGLAELPPAQAQRVRLFRLLLVDAALLRGRLDKALAPSGITSQQGALLHFIEAQGEPPTLSQVAAGMGMTHQNVKQIAAALERKGFLEINPCPQDGRARRLAVTASHRAFWKSRNADDFAQVGEWTRGLSDQEVDTVVRLLGRLAGQLRADGGEPG